MQTHSRALEHLAVRDDVKHRTRPMQCKCELECERICGIMRLTAWDDTPHLQRRFGDGHTIHVNVQMFLAVLYACVGRACGGTLADERISREREMCGPDTGFTWQAARSLRVPVSFYLSTCDLCVVLNCGVHTHRSVRELRSVRYSIVDVHSMYGQL